MHVLVFLLLAGCATAQAEQIPQTPILEISDPSPGDPPTFYECTSADKLSVHVAPDTPTSATIEVTGLGPGERIQFAFQRVHYAGDEGWEDHYITVDPAQPADDNGYFKLYTTMLDPVPDYPNTWIVKVIHSGSVACLETTLPEK